MEQNDTTQYDALEEQSDELDSDSSEESEEQEESEEESQGEESTETEADLQARLAKAESEAAKYRRLFQKAAKPAKKEQSSEQRPPSVDVDERILRAQGLSDELLDELRVVAKGRGVDLITAQQDPLFIAAKERLEEEAQKKAASLGASRGSGAVKPKKDFSTPGLSDEEHRELFRKALKR